MAERQPFPERDSIPPDGILSPGGTEYITGTGQIVAVVHSEERCAGRACVIHNPSVHSMRNFPTYFRFDRYLMERICPHHVGHPDPDDVDWQDVHMPDRAAGVHGCDGCCAP